MDRQDVFNYSLCCKEFNAESMRLVWSHIDIPGPLYRSSRGVFEDACNALVRVPERGKYVKSVAFLSRVGVIAVPRRIDPTQDDDVYLSDLIGQTTDLMPNVRSFAILRSAATSHVDPVQMASRDRITALFLGKVQQWLGRIPLRHWQSDFIPLKQVLHILQYCPSLSRLSVRLPPQDLFNLDLSELTTWSSANLPHLSKLDVDIQCIPLFVSAHRTITDISFQSLTSHPDSQVLTQIGDTLRGGNKVEVLQFTNLPTATIAQFLSIISPLPCLRKIVERDKRWSDEPFRCQDWVPSVADAIRHIPSLETYVVLAKYVAADDVSTGGEYVKRLARCLDIHIPLSHFPILCRIVFEVDRGAGSSSPACRIESLLYKRDIAGSWQGTRCVGWIGV